MLRASVFPLSDAAPPWPGINAPIDQVHAWMERVWADAPRADAIRHAAPVLAITVQATLDGTERRPARVRRASRALARYLLRMQHRATPFGLFAGAAPARIGHRAHVSWDREHRASASVDAVWLHDITTLLEADPAVLEQLTVVADSTAVVRGTQIIVRHQPGDDGPIDTSLRRTRAAEKVLDLARSAILVRDLVDKLSSDYPQTHRPTIMQMVRELVAHRVLLTSLRAPTTCTDALGHLVSRLDDVDAAPIGALRDLHRLLERHNQAPSAEQPGLRAEAVAAMRALAGNDGRHLGVNIRPDCDVVVPRQVAHEAERALHVMARISPFPKGSPAWRDYRSRFLERYSMGAVVPVRELTDPDTGLGFPVGYRGTVLKRPVLATTRRDEHLLALVQDAGLTGQREIVLTGRDIEALSVGEPAQVPAHAEMCFSVLAQDTRALTQGRFLLSAAGLSVTAGTLTGRFWPTMEPGDQQRMSAEYLRLPTLTEGAIRAQVSAPPLKHATLNVSRAPRAAAPEELAVGEHNTDTTLDLNDLGVIADFERLCLVSLSTGQAIEASVLHAAELSNATHPLVRFLCEVSRSHTAILAPFVWGAAAQLPFLPEVRYGRTILSPACWRLSVRDLGDPEHWRENFANWRVRYGVPSAVSVGSDDQQLHLDLDLTGHQDLLRAELNRHGATTLHERPDESAFGWIGHAHELTMAFAATQEPAPEPRRGTVRTLDAERLPGADTWAYLKVYGSTDRTPEVLTGHLPRLLGELDTAHRAWFIRYADPDPHLRIRLHLPSADTFGRAAHTVAAWAAELREEGMIQRIQWDTDQPETGRYGTGAALDAAQVYFATDSTAALAQMRLGLSADLQPAVTAASFVDIAAGFLGSCEAAHTWLAHHLARSEGTMAPRDVQALALRLTEEDHSGRALADVAGGDEVRRVWQRRREAIDRYHQALTDCGADPSGVLPSLLHMHHNRVAGIDSDAEAVCRRLTRAAALSWTSRRQGATS
ncbi:lantibiotic dehydratase [Streptomyces sp. A108]|nr:lantibiotic dehydratase [Streptomyces sp. A108]